MKTMCARYAGTCTGCGGRFSPGTTIGYGGKGKTFHEDCSDAADSNERVHYGFTSNGRSRCEDAPCCGCCD